ncbi:hypothetical protein COD67_07740 [Bacillus cereus]|nr:hypothetical protein COI89_13300 [Bacillus cereus]PGU68089.1 hypothetical protein COD67_07740 [Bacillus cereus]
MSLFEEILNKVKLETEVLEEFKQNIQVPLKHMYIMYEASVEAGFSEEQAFELVKGMLISGMQQK